MNLLLENSGWLKQKKNISQLKEKPIEHISIKIALLIQFDADNGQGLSYSVGFTKLF